MRNDNPSEKHVQAANRRLGHLAGIQAKTDQAEKRIRDSAYERMAVVRSELDKLRPRALTDDDAGGQYQRLITELAQLQMITGSS